MTALTTARARADVDAVFTGARHAHPVIEAITSSIDEPARAFIVGNAGSGKSTVLRGLHDLVVQRGTPATILDADTDIARVPRSQVLIVDDLHLLDAPRVEALQERSSDLGAGLIAASRPWPRTDGVRGISRHLERATPAVVLGEVSRSDALAYLDARGHTIPPACVDHLLDITGGVTWLMAEALGLHDESDCAGDGDHRAVRRMLEARIAHRLDTLDARLRSAIELTCVSSSEHPATLGVEDASTADDIIAEGFSEGLLLRNGHVVPLVRSAVRSILPLHRLIELSPLVADGIAQSVGEGDESYREWIRGIGDPRIGAALVAHADHALESDPARARELYQSAIDSGVAAGELGVRRALAAWGSGDLDAAASLLDAALDDPQSAGDHLADAAAAVWSARAMMTTASDVYVALASDAHGPGASSTIAHAGVGAADRLSTPAPGGAPGNRAVSSPGSGLPSTLGVAMRLLDSGLRASLAPDPSPRVLGDLVRASELYTASGASTPMAELPAIVAAAAAIGQGDVATAYAVIQSAVRGGQGGSWARARLLLWNSWVALQNERHAEARQALSQAEERGGRLSPRDALLAQAIRVELARRYEDLASLEAAWRAAQDDIRHVEVDLYTLLPVASLVSAGGRVGDDATMAPHFDRAIEILEALDSPPLWAVHVRWAGIQQGILRNRPDSLAPHARALVEAASHSDVAATMAQAGRVWTAVLAAHVDPDVVEEAARGLASAGLAWDGARLAGHGAGRTDDRKAAARLLACARELHPHDAIRKARPAAEDRVESDAGPGDHVALSEREVDVARLVLQGKTYAEIGATIFISPRTAEHHIAHIRRRLGATSRSDLIAKLRVILEGSATLSPQSRREVGVPSEAP